MVEVDMAYNVALVYTREAKGYEGVITYTSFESKEDFDQYYTNDLKKKQRVLEEGISKERCIELVHQTPTACRIAAAIEDSILSTGELDEELLQGNLTNVQYILA